MAEVPLSKFELRLTSCACIEQLVNLQSCPSGGVCLGMQAQVQVWLLWSQSRRVGPRVVLQLIVGFRLVGVLVRLVLGR